MRGALDLGWPLQPEAFLTGEVAGGFEGELPSRGVATAHGAIPRMADGTTRHSCNTRAHLLREQVWLAHFKCRVRQTIFPRDMHVQQLYLCMLASRGPSSQVRCTGGVGAPLAQTPPHTQMHRLCSTGSGQDSGNSP